MPYHVAQTSRCPISRPWAVIKDDDDTIMGCHATREAAERQMRAIHANEPTPPRPRDDEE